MSRCYQIHPRDKDLLWAAQSLVGKTMAWNDIKPAQTVTIAKLLHALSILPRVTPGVNASLRVTSQRKISEDHETQFYWEIETRDGHLSISNGGYVCPEIAGREHFTAMIWEARPQKYAWLRDYSESLQEVPGIKSFVEGVKDIDFGSNTYLIEVEDDDNSLLQDEDNVEGKRHDHHCVMCDCSYVCNLGEYCHLPTELLCLRHGTDYSGGWYFDKDEHVHECLQCEEHDGEAVSTFDWVHEEPQCIEPRFWPCERHRGTQSAE